MEQATTTITRQTLTKGNAAALFLLALAVALALAVFYPASPALAQEQQQEQQQQEQQEVQPPPGPSDRVTFSFELTAKGEVPEGTRLLGFIPAEGGITVPLADPDGDGVYTGSTALDRFGPGPRPVPPGTEPVSLPIQIAQESGGNIEVIRDFGVVPLEGDRTFRARINFNRDRGDTETPEETEPATTGSGGSGVPDLADPQNGVDLNEDGSTDEADGEVAAATSDAAMEVQRSSGGRALPATGGVALPAFGVAAGALLVVGGFLVRGLVR